MSETVIEPKAATVKVAWRTSSMASAASSALLAVTILSWFAYPMMAKQFSPTAFNVTLLVGLAISAGLCVKFKLRAPMKWTILDKAMVCCWAGYLAAVLIASTLSGSPASIVQWGILATKVSFFFLLINFADPGFVLRAMRIYMDVAVAVVLLSALAMLLAFHEFEPLGEIFLGGRAASIYPGAFYVTNTSILMPHAIYRIQGLSEEPGSFGFSLLPALVWSLLVIKSRVRSLVLVAGIVLSMSFGAALAILCIVPFFLFRARQYLPIFMIALTTACVGGLYSVSSRMTANSLVAQNDPRISAALSECSLNDPDSSRCIALFQKSLSTSADAKLTSMGDRTAGLLAVLSHLQKEPLGTGAGVGLKLINNSVSVGYAVAALESGVVGGLFYAALFLTLGLIAAMTALRAVREDDNALLACSSAVLCLLIMGLQRMQPDQSFWHMWVYACFYILLRGTAPEAQGCISSSVRNDGFPFVAKLAVPPDDEIQTV